MSQYHWEADQEDFLVLAGQALLIIEGDERPLRAWDLIHCPAGVSHVILGQAQVPASWWPLGRAIARRAPTGAPIPSTLPPCDIAPGSGKKRPSRTKPTQGCVDASRWPSTLTGGPGQRSDCSTSPSPQPLPITPGSEEKPERRPEDR